MGEIDRRLAPNEHFKAAIKQAEHLPFIYSRTVKHAQQQGILRELLAGGLKQHQPQAVR